jgi:MoxR-like ATPase
MDVNHAQLEWLISVFRANSKPLFISGATGIGKSERAYVESKKYAAFKNKIWVAWNDLSSEDRKKLLEENEVSKYHLFIDVRTALLEPTDLMGIPSLTGAYVEWRPTLLFKVLSSSDVSATLFFDEFNLGTRLVMSASYQIVLDKAIGETKLGKDVFIIAAGNRVEDMANIIEMPAPLNNRFGHCTLMIPTHDEWIAYNLASENAEPRLAGFLKFMPGQVHTFRRNQAEKAFSTPRSLQELAGFIKALDEQKEDELDKITLLAKAKCGDTFGVQFRGFLELHKQINLDELLNNPEKIKEYKDSEKLDVYYAIISGLAIRCKEKFANTIEPVFKICYNLDEEYAVFLLRMIESVCTRVKLANALRRSDFYKQNLAMKLAPLLGIVD